MSTANEPNNPNSYELHLSGFTMPEGNGTASLRVLADLQRRLEPVAAAAVRLAITGTSIANGRSIAGLSRATDFSLNGMRTGSTILELTAPKLRNALIGQQAGDLFASAGFDSLPNESALSVAMQAFEAAFSQDLNSPLLDRNLLQKMQGMHKLLPKNGAIHLVNQQPNSGVILTRDKLRQLQPLVASVPAPAQVVLVGKLEEMKHSAGVLKLALATGELIKVLLPVNVPFTEILSWFGQPIRVQGEANYNAAGRILAVEALHVTAEDSEGRSLFFSQVQPPMAVKLDLTQLKSQQGYRGTDIEEVKRLAADIDWEEGESFEALAARLTA